MSTHYNTEPPPTASVVLHTTAGSLTLSLFAQQTPLTTRNFLQHCLDGTYNDTLFHRVAPGFVIQTGDPTGTGEGGENIYDDQEFEKYDDAWARVTGREKGEKIVFKDEIHSRLKFNRRGLVGMARSDGSAAGGGYGTQFFVTLGDCRAELDGRCTMFGRVEGDSIYNVVKIAEGELVEGSERPVYPEKILRVEILQMPKGEAWEAMTGRERIAKRTVEEPQKKAAPKKGKKKAKQLLSFGGDDEAADGEEVLVKPKKAKYNTALIDGPVEQDDHKKVAKDGGSKKEESALPARRPPTTIPSKRRASDAASSTPSPNQRRKPSSPDPSTQLPLHNPELPSHSPSVSRTPSPHRPSATAAKSKSTLESEIAALKASMRRGTSPSRANNEASRKQSALEALIPSTSTRGRKRPRGGDGTGSANSTKEDAKAVKMLDAFRKRLEGADKATPTTTSKDKDKGKGKGKASTKANGTTKPPTADPQQIDDNEEEPTCDLHFIANCQSCFSHDLHESTSNDPLHPNPNPNNEHEDDNDTSFLSHSLTFAKDRLGKDLNWRKQQRNRGGGADGDHGDDDDDGGLVVIDPRAKAREVLGKEKGGRRGREWDRDRGRA